MFENERQLGKGFSDQEPTVQRLEGVINQPVFEQHQKRLEKPEPDSKARPTPC